MKNHFAIFKALLFTASAFILHSCTSPKAYQKIYLNDAEMELVPRKAEKFENSFQVYREGASGANGGKTGGGCGCN
jgi:hypothetical protein